MSLPYQLALTLSLLCSAFLAPGPLIAAPGAETTTAGDEHMPEAAPGPFGLQGSLEDRFTSIASAKPVYEDGFSLSNKSFKDGHLNIYLEKGFAVPIRTPQGADLGFWFTGTCSVSYSPPLGQESAAMERATSRRALKDSACKEALLLSDDPAILNWLGQAARENPRKEVAASSWLRFRLKQERMPGKDNLYFVDFAVSAIRRSLGAIESSAHELTVLQLDILGEDFGKPQGSAKAANLDWLAYRRLPEGRFAAGESHVLYAGHFAEKERRYGLNLTSHGGVGWLDKATPQPNVDLVKAELDLDISVGFDPWAEMEAKATLTLTTRALPTDAIALEFLREHRFQSLGIKKALGFTVESVRDFKGRPLDFLHYGGLLLVSLRSPLPPGQAEVLSVSYRGNAMPRLTDDSFGLLANYPWWPQTGNHDRFTFAVTICTPPSFKVAGTGTTLRTWKQDGKACERWEEPVPITFPAINMGRWVKAEQEGPRGIKIRAFFLREDELKMEPAMNSVAEMLRFYEGIHGPYPYAELDIAEARANMFFWQAPAGLLELSRNQWSARTAGKDQRRDFYPHPSLATLAHEVAHQWWGHVVGWKSYRDQWISETFAEYSSFLFMTQYEGERSYLGRLEYWEKGAQRTQKRAPMVLGFRDRLGYQGQVYRRGPHALHVLRRMVGDERFLEFMAQLPAIAANRNVSTADVETIASKIFGEDSRWFFSQWIESSGLPSLEADWKQKGKRVHLTLRQTQTGAPYRLLVPIRITDEEGNVSEHTVAIDSRELSVQLKHVSKGIKSVEIDPDRELCLAERKSNADDGDKKK